MPQIYWKSYFHDMNDAVTPITDEEYELLKPYEKMIVVGYLTRDVPEEIRALWDEISERDQEDDFRPSELEAFLNEEKTLWTPVC